MGSITEIKNMKEFKIKEKNHMIVLCVV